MKFPIKKHLNGFFSPWKFSSVGLISGNDRSKNEIRGKKRGEMEDEKTKSNNGWKDAGVHARSSTIPRKNPIKLYQKYKEINWLHFKYSIEAAKCDYLGQTKSIDINRMITKADDF